MLNWGLMAGAFLTVIHPLNLLMILIGSVGGILIGAIPGLTSTMGIALLVPFTYGMDLLPGVGMLLGIFCGAMYGGSISAILIHTPGTPSAAATVIDGYPMAQRGEAGRALGISLFSSFCGGMIGALIMTFLSPVVSRMALKFGPGEFFCLAMFGLSVIVAISGKSVLKGLISALFGLLICTVGMDKTCAYLRFTRVRGLYDGIPFIPALIGLFAISEVLNSIEHITTSVPVKAKISSPLPTRSDMKKIWRTILEGSLIGVVIGAIPGAGGDIAAFVSYAEAKRVSKHPEDFGKGVPEGIAAAECANNACSGGAMIPLLSLCVPGDSNTAVLLGAFIMKGMQPGPMMYVDHLDIVYGVFASMIVANLMFLLVGSCGVKLFAKLISVEKKYMLPAILVLSMVGSYAINQNFFDVGLAIVFGVIGYLFQKYEFPLSPILLALILGPLAESNLRRYMQIVDGHFFTLFTRPICIVMALLTVISLVSSVINQRKIAKREAAAAAAGTEDVLHS